MARNCQPDLKPNHPSSSDEEEKKGEEEDDEQASDSGSEEFSDSDSKPKPKKPLNPTREPASKPQPADPSSSSSSSESESSSDTDSDSPTKKSANIKPISSKASSIQAPPPAKAKRPPPSPENEKEKDAKKAKKTVTDSKKQQSVTDSKKQQSVTDSKKQQFQRVWSDEDEIAVMKGMIDYNTEDMNMGAFLKYIKKSLHFDASRVQLGDKVWRLKKKYLNNASRRENNGKDISFSKSHDKKVYDLSKLIWGSSTHNTGAESSKKTQTQKNGTPGLVKTNGGVDGLAMEEVEKNMDVSRFVQYGLMSSCCSPVIMEEEIVNAGLELLEGSKREELKEKWNKLKMQELKLYVHRIDLIKEQAAVVFQAMNSSPTKLM